MYQPMTANASLDPIISRLRPRSIGELLDQSFRLYRKHFLTFIAILAVVQVPMQLLVQFFTSLLIGNVSGNSFTSFSSRSSSLQSSSSTLTTLLVLYGVIIALSIVSGLLQQLSQGALTAAVANSYLDKPLSFGDSYRQMFARVGALLGVIALQFLVYLAFIVPFIVLFLIGAGLGAFGSGDAGGGGFAVICLAFLLFIVALAGVIYVSVRWTAATPVVIVEKLGPVAALRRSWALIQNSWWRTVGLTLLLSLLGAAIAQGPAFLVGIFTALLTRNLVLQQVISGGITTLVGLVYLPIQLIAITLYYFDLRVRKEGYDLETAMAQRYAPYPPNPQWGGYAQPSQYGQYGQYGQPQPAGGYGQPTMPTGGYAPPELGYQPPPSPAPEHGDPPPAERET
ncbi:MAG: glycerophosphoryl diester phosphodiesterase membrane domain-containing protein [Chloroflexota bacterium]